MKKIIYLILVAGILGTTSCKEDFEIAAPYQDIMVAYGMLNSADTAHYIRIQKAFLDNNKSSIDMAKEPDSSYFKNLDVVIKEYNDNNTFRRSVSLEFIQDMSAQGYPKDAAGSQGFFNNPSKAYKLKIDSLNPYYKYRLVVKNNNTGAVDSSHFFMVVNGARSKNAQNFYIDDFTKGDLKLSFARTAFQAKYTLYGTTPRNARMIEGILRFNIVEVNIGTGERKRRSADYTFAKDVKNGSQEFKLETLNTGFYGFLYDAFGPAPANTQRLIDSCDIFVYAGSNELYTYTNIAQVQNSSLLGDQIKPIYSNMIGSNAYGIIASRALATYRNAAIDEVTLDSIKLNSITKSLNIVGRTTD